MWKSQASRRFRFYPERPAAVIRRVAGDLLTVAWIYGCIRAAMWMHDLIEMLARPGEQVQRLAGTLAVDLDAVGETIGDIPLVGDRVTEPFTHAAGTAQKIADAGRTQQEWVHQASWAIPVLLLAVPLGMILFLWLPRRIRGARRTAVVAGLRDNAAGLDLLALRALAAQPVTALAAARPDLAQAWRRGDAAAIADLAALELRHSGLRAPRPLVAQAPAYDLPAAVDPWS